MVMLITHESTTLNISVVYDSVQTVLQLILLWREFQTIETKQWEHAEQTEEDQHCNNNNLTISVCNRNMRVYPKVSGLS
jgi:hypothetical protein